MNKIEKVMKRLTLVQNISNAGTMKVQGEDIDFAQPEDEFARYLIAEIPSFYWAIKKIVSAKELNKELIDDARGYLEHFESLAEVFLEESKCKDLGE